MTVTIPAQAGGGGDITALQYAVHSDDPAAEQWIDAVRTASGAYQFAVPADTQTHAQDGTHTFDYSAIDAAGNTSHVGTVTVKIDTTPPSVTPTSPNMDVTAESPSTAYNRPVFDLKARDEGGSGPSSVFDVIVDDRQVTAPTDGPLPIVLSGTGDQPATHTIVVTGRDVAGNTATWTKTFTVATRTFKMQPSDPTEGSVVGFYADDSSATGNTNGSRNGKQWRWSLTNGSHTDSFYGPVGFATMADPREGDDSYTIKLTVTDTVTKAVCETQQTFSVSSEKPIVHVLNVEAVAGQPAILAARFLDPGWRQTHTATWKITGVKADAPDDVTTIEGNVAEDNAPGMTSGYVSGITPQLDGNSDGTDREVHGTLSVKDGPNSEPTSLDFKILVHPSGYAGAGGTAAQPATLKSGEAHLDYIKSEGDVSLYRVTTAGGDPLPYGTQVLATLRHLPVDYDLALIQNYGPDVDASTLDPASKLESVSSSGAHSATDAGKLSDASAWEDAGSVETVGWEDVRNAAGPIDWDAIRNAAGPIDWNAIRNAAGPISWSAIRNAAGPIDWDAIRNAAGPIEWDATRNAAGPIDWEAIRNAAGPIDWDAIRNAAGPIGFTWNAIRNAAGPIDWAAIRNAAGPIDWTAIGAATDPTGSGKTIGDSWDVVRNAAGPIDWDAIRNAAGPIDWNAIRNAAGPIDWNDLRNAAGPIAIQDAATRISWNAIRVDITGEAWNALRQDIDGAQWDVLRSALRDVPSSDSAAIRSTLKPFCGGDWATVRDAVQNDGDWAVARQAILSMPGSTWDILRKNVTGQLWDILRENITPEEMVAIFSLDDTSWDAIRTSVSGSALDTLLRGMSSAEQNVNPMWEALLTFVDGTALQNIAQAMCNSSYVSIMQALSNSAWATSGAAANATPFAPSAYLGTGASNNTSDEYDLADALRNCSWVDFQGAVGTWPWVRDPLAAMFFTRLAPAAHDSLDGYSFQDMSFTGLGNPTSGTDVSPQQLGFDSEAATHMRVADFSANTGTTADVVWAQKDFVGGDTYLAVRGANGANSASLPYTIQVETSIPTNTPDLLNEGVSENAKVQDPIDHTTTDYTPKTDPDYPEASTFLPETLFVTQGQRIDAVYGNPDLSTYVGDAQPYEHTVLPALKEACKSDLVKGDVISAPANNDTTDYAAWDQKPWGVQEANDVTEGIRTAIRAYVEAHPTIKYVVLVGSDEIIPQHRVPDRTAIGNEADYVDSSGLKSDSAIVAGMFNKMVLTDDYYGDARPTLVIGTPLYLPDYAVSRLVETPAEIAGQISTFLNQDGIRTAGVLQGHGSVVTGQDFLNDGARRVTDILDKAGLDPTLETLDTWKLAKLQSDLLTKDRAVGDLNAHCSHYGGISAYGYHLSKQHLDWTPEFLSSKLIQAAQDAAGEPAFADRLFISMGCHAGLSVPDDEVAFRVKATSAIDPRLDIAQAVAQQGGVLVGNSGFAYGDSDTVAGTEGIVADFATQATTAQAGSTGTNPPAQTDRRRVRRRQEAVLRLAAGVHALRGEDHRRVHHVRHAAVPACLRCAAGRHRPSGGHHTD